MSDQPTFETTIYDMVEVNGRISKKLFQKVVEPKLKNLEEENQQLRQIIAETLPLARRYADNRSTYVPSIVNEAIDKALELDIKLNMGNDPQYARDGMLGEWNPKTKRFEKE